MPFAVATQLMISLSPQSSANAALTRFPLSQTSSNPFEHQRVSLSYTANLSVATESTTTALSDAASLAGSHANQLKQANS